jgi:predicted dehydrogenase
MRIGIIGFGFMGRAHGEAYQKIADARVVAVATPHLKSVTAQSAVWSNLEGVGRSRLNLDGVKLTTDWRELLTMRDVEVVDVCSPTPTHLEIVTAALKAGKHVVCEKPLGRTLKETQAIAGEAARAKTFFMPAMVMRFWAEWVWLKQAVTERRYGKVLSAHFTRLSPMPPKGKWLRDGKQSGGALLDLHIHDTDFVHWLFGMPRAVFSRGYSLISGEVDHVVTQYIYDDTPLVVAEGGWTLDEGMTFAMRYTVKFERATAEFDLSRTPTLLLANRGHVEKPNQVVAADAYRSELAYFLNCVRGGVKPAVTVKEAVEVMRIVEAEWDSVRKRRQIPCRERREWHK